MFFVEFYTKNDESKPAKEFILSLDVKMRAKIIGMISILQEKGTNYENHTVSH